MISCWYAYQRLSQARHFIDKNKLVMEGSIGRQGLCVNEKPFGMAPELKAGPSCFQAV
jgi:hypothetical protein